MPIIQLETWIDAEPERVFDLSIDVDVHLASAAGTGERIVGGVRSGAMKLGDVVTWEAVHFGVRWRVSSRITAYDRPRGFTDEMVEGPFAFFRHEHRFEAERGGTRMLDSFAYRSPLGPLGFIADRLVVGRHMREFLVERNAHLRRAAEG